MDRHPELISFLKTNPFYVDAIYFRRSLMARLKWIHPTEKRRPTLDLES